ncbi:MAG: glycosyl hydrolase [Gemmatimonadota bacterium]|nr:glycosyl hydrolase [Gemmatimonadota bacterium]
MSSRPIRLLAACALLCAGPLAAQQIPPEHYAALSWRFIGPDGNRAIAVVGEPGNPDVVYVGAASGGAWKTEDAGVSWRPIFDDVDVSSVSALALAPSEPNVVWLGTGETFVIRPAHAMGDGVYRSNDAGATWRHVGLERTGRIGRIRVHPDDPETAWVCALGHAYGPQPERGVYRTTDGGETWQQVLFVSEDAGCIDLDVDPVDPRTLYASFWDVQIDTWGLDSGGPDSGVWRSRDGGETWQRLDHQGTGLPADADQHIGKVAVAVAPSDPRRVYVLTEEASPGFYRSNDAGETWELVLRNHTINERAPYYTRFGVDPQDPDRIYFTSVRFSLSIDGGKSLVENAPRGGGDTHDVWIDPTDPDRIMVADDGGLTISLNRGRSFERIVLPIAQMYHVHVDDRIPYNVYGNRQDGWSYRGPSNSRQGAIPLGLWENVGGCESGFSIPVPSDPDVVWSGCYDGGLERYDRRTGQVRSVRVWPEAAYGWAPADLKFRWHWTFPMWISPHTERETVYVGSQHVHRTTDGGESWEIISPDLTRNDKSHQQSSGGVAIDNLMTFDGATLFSIAESPRTEGLLWVGSNDGLIHVSRDGGGTWTEVGQNVPGLPQWATISSIEPSRYAEGTAYVAVDNHQQADFTPHLYKTEDFGRSWRSISSGIPASPHSFVHVVREDPKRQGMLYAGTDNAVWFSLDDGSTWNRLRNDMPPAPVYWLTVQERFDDLVVGTYGRGFYILDGIEPLRSLDRVGDRSLALFTLRDAYRFNPIQGIKSESSFVTGRNPAGGADLNFWAGEGMRGRATLTIVGPGGDTIRTLRTTVRPGVNRVWWDLRHEPTKTPQLRTPPPGMEWVPLGPDGWRPLRTWDLDLVRGQLGPRAVPGTYTVHVRAGEQESSGPLTLLKDPHSTASLADLEEQVAMSLVLRDEIDRIVTMINDLEWTRKQLDDVQTRFASDTTARALIDEAERAERAAIEVESRLFDIYLTGAREDAFRNPMKLYGRYSALAQDVGYSSADFRPTVPQREVHEVLQGRLEEAAERYRALVQGGLEALNALLRQRGLPAVVSEE